ncbi:plasmid replication DNA-binding protein KfrA [Azospirillum brasilense]|nr:plasmid replication DNA-binding protein KfrA [Azospirillum brasilense]
MSTRKVSDQMVANACNQLRNAQKEVTYKAVRQLVGDQGSLTTIRNGMKAWQQQGGPTSAPLSPEDQSDIIAFAQTLMDKLTQRQRAETDRLSRDAEERIRQAEGREAELAELYDLLQSELDEERSARQAAEERLREVKRQHDQARAEQAAAAAVMARCEQDLAAARARVEQLQLENGALGAQVELARNDAAREAGAAALLREQIADLTVNLRLAQAERDEARNPIQELQPELPAVQRRGATSNRAGDHVMNSPRQSKQRTLNMEGVADTSPAAS